MSTIPAKTALPLESDNPSPLRSTSGELSPWSKIRAEVLDSKVNPTAKQPESPAKNGNDEDVLSAIKLDVPQRRVQKFASRIEEFSSSDSDDAPPRPVGRMAARLVAADDNSQSQALNGDSYARVKRLLMGKKDHGPGKDVTTGTHDQIVPGATYQEDEEERQQPIPEQESGSEAQPASPNLFVSPVQISSPLRNRHDPAGGSDSDSDMLPSLHIANERFQALVAKKRAERLAREQAVKHAAEDARQRAAEKLSKEVEELGKILSEEVDDEEDRENRKRLTQQSRPARKASKKALEEMNRETQRLARNQQLTHQAMVKRKFTTQDLFKRFNYRQDGSPREEVVAHTDDEYVMSGALISSDAEGQKVKDTPPSSPPSVASSQKKPVSIPIPPPDLDITLGDDGDTELPTLEDVMSQPMVNADKVKPRIQQQTAQKTAVVDRRTNGQPKRYRIRPPPNTSNISDSDEDIEIVNKPRFAVFDKLPSAKKSESHSLLNLRALAHLTSPSKDARKGRKSLTPTELQLQLQRRARDQALQEKQERIAQLRAKGVIIQTEEEREKEQLELESLLEKARQEAMEIAKREKKAAEKEGQPGAEGFEDSDDEDDGEYEESDKEMEDGNELEVSGSEEEENIIGEDDDEENDGDLSMEKGNPMIDDAAGEDDEDEDVADTDDQSEGTARISSYQGRDEVQSEAKALRSTKARRRNVVEEDDDEDEETEPTIQTVEQLKTPQPAQSSAAAAFGFKTPLVRSLGLTQMFAGTMADLDSQEEPSQTLGVEQDSLALLRQIPMATLPEPENFRVRKNSEVLIQDSQHKAATDAQEDSLPQTIDYGFSQFPSQAPGTISPTKLSEVPEPTQDAGFDLSRTPALLTAVPQSTVETVVLPEESPIVQRRGRLHRRTEASTDLAEDATEGDEEVQAQDFQLSTTAFDVLFKAAKRPPPTDDFDKNKSAARNIVEEQAEESEDEYAGLGGASDEETDSEAEEEIREMMDDSHVDVNKSKLAQLFADKERAADEKAIDKLYKDIATGALRRKRGANFDDLSEDEDNVAEERRRRKQLEFARMRKALLEDENIGKIAENPKKMAFLRAIEDRNEEDEHDFLDDGNMLVDSVPDSQVAEDTKVSSGEDALYGKDGEQSGSKTTTAIADTSRMVNRRTATATSLSRPTTLIEIRESLSFLTEDSIVPDSQHVDSDFEDEDEMDVDGPEESRQALGIVRASVVNRLSIVTRNNDEEKPDGPMAFHAPALNSALVFKVPSLLRRATTLSSTSSSSSGTTTPTTETGVRMGGSKKSSIHYQAREAERRKIVEAAERKRKEELKRSVIGKSRRSVLGAFGQSTGFE